MVTVGLLVATLTVTVQSQRRAEATRQAWGDTATVWVAARSIPAGETVLLTDLQARAFPKTLVPQGAVSAAGAAGGGTGGVVGRVALVALGAGEVLVNRRLGPAGTTPIERRLGPDLVALPVPVALLPWTGTPPAAGGAVALVHRNGLVNGQIVSSGAGPTAADTDTDIRDGSPAGSGELEATVLVAVPREHAPALVGALLDGQLMVALISAPPQSRG